MRPGRLVLREWGWGGGRQGRGLQGEGKVGREMGGPGPAPAWT